MACTGKYAIQRLFRIALIASDLPESPKRILNVIVETCHLLLISTVTVFPIKIFISLTLTPVWSSASSQTNCSSKFHAFNLKLRKCLGMQVPTK